jgi:hypothetical protein
VITNQIVICAGKIAARIEALHASKEAHVAAQDVFECSMAMAHFSHENAAGFFNQLRFDQSRIGRKLGHGHAPRFTPIAFSWSHRGQRDVVFRVSPSGGIDRSRLFSRRPGAQPGVGRVPVGIMELKYSASFQPALDAAAIALELS